MFHVFMALFLTGGLGEWVSWVAHGDNRRENISYRIVMSSTFQVSLADFRPAGDCDFRRIIYLISLVEL
jgi:hypothetical protein